MGLHGVLIEEAAPIVGHCIGLPYFFDQTPRCSFCAGTIRGRRLFIWNAWRHQRRPDRVQTSETVTVARAQPLSPGDRLSSHSSMRYVIESHMGVPRADNPLST